MDKTICIMPPKTIKEVRLPFTGEVFKEAWESWKAYKLEAHKFVYKSYYSEQAALNRVYRLSRGNVEWAVILIENAMASQWEGIHQHEGFDRSTGTPPPGVKLVHHDSAPRPTPIETPPPPVISDKDFLREQFEAFKGGYLRVEYVSPANYTILAGLGLIGPLPTDTHDSLWVRSKVARLRTLSNQAYSTTGVEYYEIMKQAFTEGVRIPPSEERPVTDWAKRLAVIDFFNDLRDSALDINQLL